MSILRETCQKRPYKNQDTDQYKTRITPRCNIQLEKKQHFFVFIV